ncbi:MAG: helix-turn-helix transcriptional regulator [Oligoflexales bacterium]
MLSVFGERQQDLLRKLHRNKAGMTIDELARELNVTRTAVKQHLSSLEKEGYVARGGLRLTTGRPGRTFKLSSSGVDLFPKQYSWFSSLLMRGVKEQRGSEGLALHLRDLATAVAAAVKDKTNAPDGSERISRIVDVMNELSYEASVLPSQDSAKLPEIRAMNCVYHHLAQEFPEVCEFDVELLSRLSGLGVDHQECIIRGGNACRFSFSKPIHQEIKT